MNDKKDLEIKDKIFKRDNYRCKVCGVKLCLKVHHILSKEYGGNDEEDNLVTLCKWCEKWAPDDGEEEFELFKKDKYEYIFESLSDEKEFVNDFIILAVKNGFTFEQAKKFRKDMMKEFDIEDIYDEIEKEEERRSNNKKTIKDIEFNTEEQFEILKCIIENNIFDEDSLNLVEINLIDKCTISIENLFGEKIIAQYSDGDILIKSDKKENRKK